MSHVLGSGWSPRTSLPPCIAISAAFAYSLYILAAPHRYQLKNVVIVFVLAASFQKSFKHLYPDDLVNTVFAHATFIWLVHVAHITLVQGDAGYIAGNSTQSGDRALKEGGVDFYLGIKTRPLPQSIQVAVQHSRHRHIMAGCQDATARDTG